MLKISGYTTVADIQILSILGFSSANFILFHKASWISESLMLRSYEISFITVGLICKIKS